MFHAWNLETAGRLCNNDLHIFRQPPATFGYVRRIKFVAALALPAKPVQPILSALEPPLDQ
jgi:hypothetical protein